MSQQRELLEPFSPKAIKRVDAGGGRQADYVSWTDKMQRVLQVCGGFDWDVRIIEGSWVNEDRMSRNNKPYTAKVATAGAGDADEPVTAIGTLTVEIDGNLRRVDGVGTGADGKKAETDAFARACAKIGVGLHLWCQGGDKDGGYWITGVLDQVEA